MRASDGSVKVQAVLTEADAAAIVEGYQKKFDAQAKESSAALDQLKKVNAAALDQLKKDFAASLAAKVGAVSDVVAKVEEGLAAVSKEVKIGAMKPAERPLVYLRDDKGKSSCKGAADTGRMRYSGEEGGRVELCNGKAWSPTGYKDGQGYTASLEHANALFKNASKAIDKLRETVEKKDCGTYKFTSCHEARLEGCTSGT